MEGSGYLKEGDKIKLQEKELTALDGLWFLEVEKEWGYEAYFTAKSLILQEK